MKRILIAVPTIEYIESATFETIYALHIPQGYVAHFHTFRGYATADVRNVIAQQALKLSYEYVLFIDSDILVPPDALLKLLAADKDVVAGLYVKKQPGLKTTEAYFRQGDEYIPLYMEQLSSFGLKKVDAVGFGCVLVRTSVFTKFPAPWFTYHFSLKASEVMSEDLDFCRRANAVSVDIFVDTSIHCGHVGKQVYIP